MENQSPHSRKSKKERKLWSPLPGEPGCKVPASLVDRFPRPLRSDLRAGSGLPGGYIAGSLLHAQAVGREAFDVGDSIPQRQDSMYLHPQTMECIGLAIAQPAVVSNPASKTVTVCKLWPVKRMGIDRVAMSHPVSLNCHASSGTWLEIKKLEGVSSVPVAEELILQPLSSSGSVPSGHAFKSYILHLYDGVFLYSGNCVCVNFAGQDQCFKIKEIKLLSQHAVGSSDDPSSLLDDSLLHGLSSLALVGSGSHVLNTSVSECVAAGPSKQVTRGQCRGGGGEIGGGGGSGGGGGGGEGGEGGGGIGGGGGRGEDDGGTSCSVSPVKILCCEGEEREDQGKEEGEGEGEGEGKEGEWEQRVLAKVTLRTRIVFQIAKQKQSQKINFSMIGGMKEQIQLLKDIVLYPLQHSHLLNNESAVKFARGVLLSGPSGVGKTLLAQALASETIAHTIHLSAFSISSGSSQSRLKEALEEAKQRCPCLVVIDDLDRLCPQQECNHIEDASAAMATMLEAIHQHASSTGHIVVLATTSKPAEVNSSLMKIGYFDEEIEIPVPTARDRVEIMTVLLKSIANRLGVDEITEIGSNAHGFVGGDLCLVCKKAQTKAFRRMVVQQGHKPSEVVVSLQDMKDALHVVRPSALREVAVEVPKVLWSDIGGEEEIKQELIQSVEWPLKHPQTFARLGVSPPKGVLLYGPPGCSKTMIARALATESSLNFIAVQGPQLFSKYVGDSERAVRQVFSRARAAAPAIVFFDEVDAMAVRRKGEGTSVGDRMVAQLLTEMDGVELLQDVLVVAATNRPDLIDKALTRPGRIDKMIYVPLPVDKTRREILRLQFLKTPVHENLDLERLVKCTEGFSGAEVVHLCQEAALRAMQEDITKVDKVEWRHFELALQHVKPQTTFETLHFYNQFHLSNNH